MSERLSAERLEDIRTRWPRLREIHPDVLDGMLEDVLTELDAVTHERDEARKHLEERGQMLFDEQMARQRAERERDEARKDAEEWRAAWEAEIRGADA